MDPNMHHNLFSMRHFGCTYTHNLKLQVVYRRSTYWMTALLWEMSMFCVRAGCEIRLVSYSSKHASQSLSNKPFVRTYTHNLKTIGHILTFSISNDFSTIGDISCVPWSCMRDPNEELYTAPDTYQSFSDITLCAYTAILLYIAVWCTATHDNKTQVPHHCILHTKWRLHCQQRIIL